MTQKVATERKMQSRRETTSLGQNATVTAKPRISDEEQDRDESEIQEGEDDDSFVMVDSRVMLTSSGRTVRRPLGLDLYRWRCKYCERSGFHSLCGVFPVPLGQFFSVTYPRRTGGKQHERDVRTSQGFQSPASIMIVVPTHLGEERQCDPDLSFLCNVSNTTVTTVERPGTR